MEAFDRVKLDERSGATGVVAGLFLTDWTDGWNKTSLEMWRFLFNEDRPSDHDDLLKLGNCSIWFYGDRAVKNVRNNLMVFYKNVER